MNYVVSQEDRSCDPSTPDHAGGVKEPQLRRVHHPYLHPHGRTVQPLLPSFARSSWPGTHTPLSSRIACAETLTQHSGTATRRLAILLRACAEARLEHC